MWPHFITSGCMFEAQTHTQMSQSATVVDKLLYEQITLRKCMFYLFISSKLMIKKLKSLILVLADEVNSAKTRFLESVPLNDNL